MAYSGEPPPRAGHAITVAPDLPVESPRAIPSVHLIPVADRQMND
jgi:hypothetical protein